MNLNNPLTTGSIVTIWHGNRGVPYVIAGLNRGDKTLSLLRQTCINNDGTIHASTVGFHKEIPIEDFMEGIKVAPKVNRVLGTKVINRRALAEFTRQRAGDFRTVALNTTHEVYPPIDVTADIRNSATF